jgi:hypothetical protein
MGYVYVGIAVFRNMKVMKRMVIKQGIMKKWILILFSLILTSLLLSDENNFKEFTEIDSMKDEFITNSLHINTEYEGYCVDYALAKFTGEIIIASKYNTTYYINFYNSNGDRVWGEKIPDKGYSISCCIAKNGSAVAIAHYSSEFYLNWVYDREGNLLFKNRYKCLQLQPLHNGNFFYDTTSMKQNNRKTMIIFDRDGNDFDLIRYEYIDDNIVRLELVDCNKELLHTDLSLSDFTPLKEVIGSYNLHTISK